jgi:hypothetical protein
MLRVNCTLGVSPLRQDASALAGAERSPFNDHAPTDEEALDEFPACPEERKPAEADGGG